MNDIVTVSTLSDGANAIMEKVARLRELSMKYADACEEHDTLAKYMLGQIDSVSVTIKGKQANARNGTQRTFQMENSQFEPGLQPILDKLHAKCMELYNAIQEVKESI